MAWGSGRYWLILTVLTVVLLAAWVSHDLTGESRHSLRRFDGHEVGMLETRMWRSYYEHHSLRLFADLTTLLRQQYQMPFWRAVAGAYYAARAAVVFQKGSNRGEYELALPDLVRYYELVRRSSEQDFPVERVSALELEWWIVHRERAQHLAGDLARALAAEQAEIYQQPATDFAEHAQTRADAMTLRDSGGTEADWTRIGELLDRSWTSLERAVSR